MKILKLVKHLLFLALILFCLVGGAIAQTSAADFMKDITNQLQTQPIEKIREQFKTDPPKGTFLPDRLHWLKLRNIANVLGDTQSVVYISERAVKSDPSDMQYQRWLAEALAKNNEVEKAVPIYRVAAEKERANANERVRYHAAFANVLIDAGQFAEAKKVLDNNEAWEKIHQWRGVGLSDQAWPTLGAGAHNGAYCHLYLAQLQYAMALKFCEISQQNFESAVGLAEQISSVYKEVGRSLALGGHLTASLQLAQAFALDGQHFRAERIMQFLRDKAQVASAAQFNGVSAGRAHFVDIFTTHAELRLLQNRLKEAADYAAIAKDEALAAERGFLGVKTKSAIETKLKIAMLRDAWSEMGTDFTLLDKLVKDDPDRAPQVQLALLRALWFANDSNVISQSVNIDRAKTLMQAWQAQLQKSVGDKHFLLSLAEGLRLSFDAKVNGRAVDVARLASVCQTLLDPDLSGQNLAVQTVYQPLLQSIFETLLTRLSADSDVTTQAIGFEVADALRANNVQKSVQAAALRMSFSDTKLASTIRELQDTDLTLQTLAGRVSSLIASGIDGEDVAFKTLREQIAQVEQKKKTLAEALNKQNAQYAALTKFKPATVTRVAGKLAPDEVFVAAYPMREKIATWLVLPNGEVKFSTATLSEAELKGLIGKMRKTLDVAGMDHARMPAFDTQSAKTLYAQAFASLLSQYAKTDQVNHVVLSVAGALTQIPLSVLQTGDVQKPWLVQQYGVSQITSASSWLALREAKRTPTTEPIVAWGDPLFALAGTTATDAARAEVRAVRATVPAMTNEERTTRAFKYDQIPPLPETRDEIKSIAKVLGSPESKNLFFGAEAHKQSVLDAGAKGMLAKANVLAFATHGLMAGDLPGLTQPALALAQRSSDKDNPVAPLLLLSDILTLQTNAQWVVLSACNTAASDGTGEEAISGLARGFFYAGAKSVLATHWAVESNSAAMLTTHTFEHQAKNPTATKAQSLRHAMLQVMNEKDYAHPTYWAPYALFGDGGK